MSVPPTTPVGTEVGFPNPTESPLPLERIIATCPAKPEGVILLAGIDLSKKAAGFTPSHTHSVVPLRIKNCELP